MRDCKMRLQQLYIFNNFTLDIYKLTNEHTLSQVRWVIENPEHISAKFLDRTTNRAYLHYFIEQHNIKLLCCKKTKHNINTDNPILKELTSNIIKNEGI